ncbi:aminotransferase class IV [Cellulomonas sp. ATA003]|uniref:aminotransferase class IV n=1 Tax=Cellulomonas sp. ATA003 TaxID=3073064 RepID=UPI002873EA0A|nr:aminotransferase class IV [Cellulomonas sp. ATA003]WNB87334.1 aminotransferase class IV [Cellulomonas sp. ATA003]
MSIVIWSGGRLREADEAVVTAVDHGLTVGDGVFETCAVHDGRAFALTRHLRRLERSATGLGLPAPDADHIRTGVAAVLAAAGPSAGRVRITVTGGPGPMGSNRLPAGEQRPTVVVVAAPATRAPSSRVVRVPWVRNERSAVAGLKTTSYAENVVALAYAAERGGDEALLANTVGDLCEGTGSNVVVEREGELLTPPLSSGCLAGITRELFLEWSRAAGLPVRESEAGELRWEVLDDVLAGRAHLALTSSTRHVQPVVALDGEPLEPGPLTREAQRVFDARLPDDLDP